MLFSKESYFIWFTTVTIITACFLYISGFRYLAYFYDCLMDLCFLEVC